MRKEKEREFWNVVMGDKVPFGFVEQFARENEKKFGKVWVSGLLTDCFKLLFYSGKKPDVQVELLSTKRLDLDHILTDLKSQ